MTKQQQSRFDFIIAKAQLAFWQTLKDEYPVSPETYEGVNIEDSLLLKKVAIEIGSNWYNKNVCPVANKTTEILLHTIEYWYKDADESIEISEVDVELIKNLIIQGYNKGELATLDLDDNTWSGWWSIKK